MPEELLFFLVALGASVVGAISGIGGGIIIKPLLEAASGYGVATVSFLSGCAVLSMSMVSMLRRGRLQVEFEPRRGTLLACGSAAGGLIGKIIFDSIGERWGGSLLGATQASLMFLMAAGLLVYLAVKSRLNTRNLQGTAACLGLGGALGLISAFLGIGGGPMNLAVLSYFLSMDNKRAALHSLYIVLFSQAMSLSLTLARGRVPQFTWLLMTGVVLGGVSGALIGGAFSRRMSNKGVGNLYAAVLVFVLIVSARNFWGYVG